MSDKYKELQKLAETDPSEALYRAEAELTFDEFMTFITWISNR